MISHYRTAIREKAYRVQGEYVIRLDDLKPVYDALESLAKIGLALQESEAVIRVETTQGVHYRIDDSKAEWLWSIAWGKEAE
jgi:hypothetical protein